MNEKEARREARTAALLDAADIVRTINEAADVPGGNNTPERRWALECAEIRLRKAAEEAASEGEGVAPPHGDNVYYRAAKARIAEMEGYFQRAQERIAGIPVTIDRLLAQREALADALTMVCETGRAALRMAGRTP